MVKVDLKRFCLKAICCYHEDPKKVESEKCTNSLNRKQKKAKPFALLRECYTSDDSYERTQRERENLPKLLNDIEDQMYDCFLLEGEVEKDIRSMDLPDYVSSVRRASVRLWYYKQRMIFRKNILKLKFDRHLDFTVGVVPYLVRMRKNWNLDAFGKGYLWSWIRSANNILMEIFRYRKIRFLWMLETERHLTILD